MERIFNNLKIEKTNALTADKVFYACCWLYLVAFSFLPDWFGFYLGMLFSAKRIMLFICYAFILFTRERLNSFVKLIKKCTLPNILIVAYMFVCFYTAVYRLQPKAFFGEFLDGVMVFYFFCYLVKYEIKLPSLLKFLRVTLWILVLLGIFEYFTHINLFEYLNTTPNYAVGSHIRGELRIQSNCHHPIQVGIYFTILFALSCYDCDSKKLYLFRHPLLLILTTVGIFFTGSRAPIGIYILTLFLIAIFSNGDERKKTIIYGSMILSVALIGIMFFSQTDFVQNILQTFASVADDELGTTLVADYFDPKLAQSFTDSSNYRDVLVSTVFHLDYLNKFVGRGERGFSIWMNGFSLGSTDNYYVQTYISYAYPGLITFCLLLFGAALFCLGALIRKRNQLFSACFIAIVGYIINLWYVSQMGTMMYFWMVFAIAYTSFKVMKEK